MCISWLLIWKCVTANLAALENVFLWRVNGHLAVLTCLTCTHTRTHAPTHTDARTHPPPPPHYTHTIKVFRGFIIVVEVKLTRG